MSDSSAFDSDRSSKRPSSDQKIVARVQRALLTRIAQASTSRHLTISADGPWQPFLEGIRCRVLCEHAEALSYLLELQPGAVLPAHRHPRDEECIVLRGTLRIGEQLKLSEGDYHLARAGELHAAITTDSGALIFLRGAPPEMAHCI